MMIPTFFKRCKDGRPSPHCNLHFSLPDLSGWIKEIKIGYLLDFRSDAGKDEPGSTFVSFQRIEPLF
jgi:hypothetical protein